jgi:transcriptional regulator with XRE-family HTH domain
MSFAQRTKALKASRGMTTEDLARKSGVPQSTLNKILTGVIEEPKLSVAQAIAAALGCPLGMLLDGARDFTDTMNEEEMELVRKILDFELPVREKCCDYGNGHEDPDG